MDNITNVETGWRRIGESVRGKGLVPVLGLEINSLLLGTDTEPESVQRVELGRVRGRLEHIGESIEEALKDKKDPHDPFKVAFEQSLYYLGNLKSSGVPTVSEAPPEDEHDKQLAELRLHLMVFSTQMTRVWAEEWWRRPKSLGISHTEDLPSALRDRVLSEEMKTILTLASRLTSRAAADWTEPQSLRIDLVYAKLLRLAAEIFGDDSKFWTKEVLDTHEQALDRLTSEAVGLSLDGSPGQRRVNRMSGLPQAGVRMSHLRWLEGLSDHMLFAGTRAYRNRSQLAFDLALLETTLNVPNDASDLFEVGILFTRNRDEADRKALRDTFRFCGEDEAGAPRLPSAFHRALAALLQWAIHADEAGANGSLQCVLSMCLDLEMERAIEREFDAYRVLVPVFFDPASQQTCDDPFGDLAGSDSSGTCLSRDKGWMLASVRHNGGEDRHDVTIEWSVFEAESDVNDSVLDSGEGPIVIKMFGSPLHDTMPETATRTGGDSQAAEIRVTPRLLLDETSILEFRKDAFPTSNRLETRIAASSLCFFGQDALTWSDRVPFTGMANLMGDASAATKAFTFGHSSIYGEVALDRVGIVHPGSGFPDPLGGIAKEMVTKFPGKKAS